MYTHYDCVGISEKVHFYPKMSKVCFLPVSLGRNVATNVTKVELIRKETLRGSNRRGPKRKKVERRIETQYYNFHIFNTL